LGGGGVRGKKGKELKWRKKSLTKAARPAPARKKERTSREKTPGGKTASISRKKPREGGGGRIPLL